MGREETFAEEDTLTGVPAGEDWVRARTQLKRKFLYNKAFSYKNRTNYNVTTFVIKTKIITKKVIIIKRVHNRNNYETETSIITKLLLRRRCLASHTVIKEN